MPYNTDFMKKIKYMQMFITPFKKKPKTPLIF